MIKLPPETEERLVSSIKRYVAENLDDEIGDLKATLLLEFVNKEIGPSIYNQAIKDAQAHLHDRVRDLDESCSEPEFGYWQR